MDGHDKALVCVAGFITILEAAAICVMHLNGVLLSGAIAALTLIAKHIYDRAIKKGR